MSYENLLKGNYPKSMILCKMNIITLHHRLTVIIKKLKPNKMKYYLNTTITGVSFDDAIDRVSEALKKEGFGVLTDIDIKATMKKKLDVDLNEYRILGACNPGYAYKALQEENKIGTMLPCNVIVQENNDGTIEISAVDPIASMQAVENENLGSLAIGIKNKLQKVIDSL